MVGEVGWADLSVVGEGGSGLGGSGASLAALAARDTGAGDCLGGFSLSFSKLFLGDVEELVLTLSMGSESTTVAGVGGIATRCGETGLVGSSGVLECLGDSAFGMDGFEGVVPVLKMRTVVVGRWRARVGGMSDDWSEIRRLGTF